MSGPLLDLDPESRRALEFGELLDVVASYARTPMGARRIRSLRPVFDAELVATGQATVAEAEKYLAIHGKLLPAALPDPGAVLEALAVERARIEPKSLRDLASTVFAASELRLVLKALPAGEFPNLRALGDSLPDLRAEARPVLQHVDPEGRIADDASPELRRIRTSIRRVGARLRCMLQAQLRDPEAEAVIRDDFITQRNGRFVIPVRTDAPRPVQGIVHASSSSGATLFVEPLESVALNNELVGLAEEEIEEQGRILHEWASRFRRRRGDVTRAVEGISVADSLQARALFAEEAEAVAPRVGKGEPLELRGIRHPLLDRRLRERGAGCVPLHLQLDPSDQVLVLSGPNTGGKTVALKTLGLAVLMAQSGIPVPATEARLPLFRQVRADIGDHQSIQADLSTFSAHLKAVVRFLEELETPALFLFDEIGTGTEPTEGAALARSILEGLLPLPGMTAVATTHQGALKAWAFTTRRALSAAMEFDTRTLRPTYRVLMGAAGVSAGLDIAARIGLDGGIVDRARGYLGDRAEQTEAYLARLRDLTAELERRGTALERREQQLEEEGRRLRERAERETHRRSQEAAKALERALEEFRERARRELASIQDQRERERFERRQRRADRKLLADLGRKKAELAPCAAEEPHRTAVAGELRAGMKVRVRSLGKEGEIVSARGDKVEVLLGRMTFTVDRADLRLAASERSAAGPGATRPVTARSRDEAHPGGLQPEPPREVMLVGKTVDEALPELDKSLDAAVLAGYSELRVIHGHGTGRLRQAVRKFLNGHPHVKAQRPGAAHEGGDGATVVTLQSLAG